MDFKPGRLAMVSTVKNAKKKDVEKLLAEMGASDNILQFYNNALSGATDVNDTPESDDDSMEEDNDEHSV